MREEKVEVRLVLGRGMGEGEVGECSHHAGPTVLPNAGSSV